MKNNKKEFVMPLYLTIFFVLSIIFEFIDPFFPLETSDRTLLQYYQGGLLLFNIFFFFACISKRILTSFSFILSIFLTYLVVYSIFSPYFVSIMLPILRGWGCFYIFYYYARKNKIDMVKIENILFLFLAIYGFWLFVNKSSIDQLYGGKFLQADNLGYPILGILIIYTLQTKNKNIYGASLAFALILFSMKRGAIVSGAIVYVLYMYYVIRTKKVFSIQKIIIVCVFLFVMLFSVYFLPYIGRRFEDGSNGRDRLYIFLWENYRNDTFFHQIFGNGFFHAISFHEKHWGVPLYAHNDWLELLHDEGIIGFFLYLLLILYLMKNVNLAKKYLPYYVYILKIIIFVWLFRSSCSSVIGKDIWWFVAIGLILGRLEYHKDAIISTKINT